jgi:hypothetical protein
VKEEWQYTSVSKRFVNKHLGKTVPERKSIKEIKRFGKKRKMRKIKSNIMCVKNNQQK